jgi:hypothetical protein
VKPITTPHANARKEVAEAIHRVQASPKRDAHHSGPRSRQIAPFPQNPTCDRQRRAQAGDLALGRPRVARRYLCPATEMKADCRIGVPGMRDAAAMDLPSLH